MQQTTLADLQDEHLCDLQPEDLSLHSNGGDDRQTIDETATELLWKQETSLTEQSKEEASKEVTDKESAGRPSSRERETPASPAGGIADVLGSAGDVATITTSTATVQDTTTASPDKIVVEKMEEAITAPPFETEQENL